MKRISFIIIGCFAVILSTCVLADTFFQSNFMKPAEAEKKWGIKLLDKKLFRSSKDTHREAMAVDIVKRNLYVGKTMKLVRQDLGDPDSYFFSDTIYAYKIMPFPGENAENWQLVFIPDELLEKVKEVKIHMKCCYKLPF